MIIPTLDLFAWWALSISFSSIFLTMISIYLYSSNKKKRMDKIERHKDEADTAKLIKNFAFVWVLVGLLIFYIFSIQLALSQSTAGTLSEVVFAIGNVVVEAFLILYLIRNREKMPPENKTKSDQTQ
jgi:uncharacterized protein YacL